MSFAGDEFMRDLWRGKVPVQFTLAQDSFAGTHQERPSPCFKLVPRVSYLAFFIGDVRQHFAGHAPAGGDADIWFSRDYDERENEVVRWHLPVGVIFDWLMLKEGHADTPMAMLPLQLSAHFTAFPYEKIARMKDDKEAMDGFHQSLKQAHMIRYASTKALQQLPASLWQDLEEAVKDCNYAKYATVRRDLQRSDAEPQRPKLPVIIHYDDAVWLRSPAAPPAAAGDDGATLGHFLREQLPELYPLREEECVAQQEPPGDRARLLVHGVTPLLQTPMRWLVEYMGHPDGFLHIVVRRNP